MRDLKSWFGVAPRPLLGIDIGSTKVALVELARVGRHTIRLERCASAALPFGAVRDGQIEQVEVVAAVLRQVWRASGARASLIALGMPPACVVTRKIILPAGLSEAELEIELAAEASQHIPFALDEASLDFDVLGPASTPGSIEVMLAACHREQVEIRVAVAEAAGLTALVIELEAYALRSAVQCATAALPALARIAVFHLGARRMHLTVSQGAQVLHESEHVFGGNELTAALMQAASLSFDVAEMEKKSAVRADSPMSLAFVERAGLAVQSALRGFFATTEHARIDHLYVTGGCALLPGLLEAIALYNPLIGAVLSPFAAMPLASAQSVAPPDAPAYAVACGLALRRFT